MLEKYQSFFAENGITSTSASHLCNIAREYVSNAKTDITRIKFVKTSVSSLTANVKPIVLDDAIDNTTGIIDIFNKIAKANAFIAYMQEAIKAKRDMFSKITDMSITEFCQAFNKAYPEEPIRGNYKLFDDFFSELDIKSKTEYYTLEAEAAVIGKAIHPDGAIHKARQQMFEAATSPAYIEDDKIYHRDITVSKEDVEKLYFELQKKHRGVEAKLNSIKNSISIKVAEYNAEIDSEFSKKCNVYASQVKLLNSDFANWKNEELKRINKLKIAIPNSLKETYDFLNNL